ncbi:hypothetical protein GOFOIKOB_2999 [Methylobacterium tardum]|uniref:Uncharacterized protein n=1 Tax=Methylobacterium tardum TaxID=374432 RepID=A0AA37WRI7_9HYPH|nr:hypothetical protein GOFOIKOB_2999 [Methylobacterium tardum]GLS70164.1 hypothetical protein GCM10007890_21770 [Methylobacterium tardum]
MPGRPDRIVAEIRKSARESVRVILREKGGQLGADLRIASTAGQGSIRETQKGLRIPLGRIGELIDALREAQRLASQLDG